jgi:hypothetical protein
MNRRFLVALLVTLVVLPLVTVEACGPDFYPDVFVLKLRPDHPKEFAAGKLGVLLPTYPRADLTVAFRYLNGGSLSFAEREGYQPSYSLSDPMLDQHWNEESRGYSRSEDAAEAWQVVRTRYAASQPKVPQDRTVELVQADGNTYRTGFENCPDDAFRSAVATLQARAHAWGEKSANLADWLKAQDAVFANCTSEKPVFPQAAPANAPPLLKADRAYQVAAAQFYGLEYGKARTSFEAIGQDSASPWQGMARYLVARCLVRQAFYSREGKDIDQMAAFDPALMKEAARVLATLLKNKPDGISRGAIQSELDLAVLRADPIARLRALSANLEGPKTDPSYAQHLTDLTWYLDNKLDSLPVRQDANLDALESEEKQEKGIVPTAEQRAELFGRTYLDLTGLRSASTLVDWLITFQSPAEQAKEHAVEEWKNTGQLFWLVAAISKATVRDAEADDLVKAAEQAAPDSVVWETLTYHRARLLIGMGRVQEARALLADAIPRIEAGKRDSSASLFQVLRMRSAASLHEALLYAPRKVINRTSEEQASLDECLDVMKNPRRKYDCKKDTAYAEFDADAASFFNFEAPLKTLAESAHSYVLPENLRSSIAMMGWVRSVLLADDGNAATFFPLLPENLQQQAGTGTGFGPLMALLRNPGLRPYLDPGVQRSYSFDFVESYADNWWCKDWGESWWGRDRYQRGTGNEALLPAQTVASFLTEDERTEGERQAADLGQMGDAEIVLGSRVLTYANNHPNDPDLPESLFLVLRLMRYGCNHASWSDSVDHKQHQREIGKSASRILRQRFPGSPWTKKAAPIAY